MPAAFLKSTETAAATIAAPSRVNSGSTPRYISAAASTPRTARKVVFPAVRPSFHSACATIAITTALIPYSALLTCGSDPKTHTHHRNQRDQHGRWDDEAT